MCGICGIVGPQTDRIDPHVKRRMTHVLAHRGPDGTGSAELAGADGVGLTGWFGHRRLKILDLSELAHQPMLSDDGLITLTYNGEIYNFADLRVELEARGRRFRSRGDTEVVLRAFEEWGADFVTRLDGMFALAVWDGRSGRLVLARDRTGKKPLFYSTDGTRMAFGSEIKALVQCPWVPREPAWDVLPEFLLYGYAPNPSTMFRGVVQVPPASTVVFDRAGVHPPERYWSPLVTASSRGPTAELLEEIVVNTRRAVVKRMVSDVPIGALLSGGIDSSLVVAFMQQASSEPIHTFSIGFPDDASYDERRYARLVADHYKTDHTEFAVSMDAVALLDRVLWHHDQPYADSSAIPTFIVSGLARERVSVVLNGDGGDEIFGGYDRFTAAALSRALPRGAIGPARRAARALPINTGYYSVRRRAERFLELADAPVEDRYQGWISVFRPEVLPELMRGPAPRRDQLVRSMNAHYGDVSHLPALDRIMYANFMTYLPDDLAVKMDRMSMAHSLEARSPFLDTDLIATLARVPARDKVGILRTKPLMRRAYGALLPDAIWKRRKHGFGVPIGTWMRGELGTMYQDLALGRDSRVAEVLDTDRLRAEFNEHMAGTREHSARLWTTLMLEQWLRGLDAPPSIEPPPTHVVRDA